MYEFTHSGAWFNWKAFDRTEKRLAAVSLAGSTLPGALMGLKLLAEGVSIGRLVNPERDRKFVAALGEWMATSNIFSVLVVLAIASTVISIIAWWRLSIRQDEMFNRVQNYALGRTAVLGMLFALIWWMLSAPGWVGAFPLGWFLLAEAVLIYLFTVRAVRKWA
jgi:hypothetical protein